MRTTSAAFAGTMIAPVEQRLGAAVARARAPAPMGTRASQRAKVHAAVARAQLPIKGRARSHSPASPPRWTAAARKAICC